MPSESNDISGGSGGEPRPPARPEPETPGKAKAIRGKLAHPGRGKARRDFFSSSLFRFMKGDRKGARRAEGPRERFRRLLSREIMG